MIPGGGDFEIRPASLEDSESARALVRELGYGGLHAATFREGFSCVLRHDTQAVWVAVRKSGEMLGLVSVSLRPQIRLAGWVATIDELVVTESARGAGVGRALVNRAKAFALERHAVRVELHTRRTRASYARGFYLKNGFVEVGSALMRWEASSS